MPRGWMVWAQLAVIALVLGLWLPLAAHAQELEPINNTLQFLVDFTQGTAARLFGILVFTFTVLAFAFGRLEPSRLFQVIFVLAAFFGAPSLVDTLIQVSR